MPLIVCLFCQSIIYIKASKILMANEAPIQNTTDILIPCMAKPQINTFRLASRFIKSHALKEHPTLASALSH